MNRLAPLLPPSSTIAPSSPTPTFPPSSPPPPPRGVGGEGRGGGGASPSSSPITNSSEAQLSPANLLQQPSKKKKLNRTRRLFNSIFQSFPIFTSPCKFPQSLSGGSRFDGHVQGGIRTTGTLFGHRKARISLAIQDNPRCLPLVLLELPVPTNKLLHDMGSGLVRIALECEKKPGSNKVRLMEEPLWTMYCNGRKAGYAAKREPSEEDLNVMQLLHAVSMGAGVVPGQTDDLPDGEMAYMRAHFGRVIGSKDSETFYMMNPDGNSGPELTIFFVRI